MGKRVPPPPAYKPPDQPSPNISTPDPLERDFDDWIKSAEKELYQALEALQNHDLIFAHSSAARAKADITAAWKRIRR